MRVYIAIVVIDVLALGVKPLTADQDVPTIEELCPHSRFCTKGPLQPLNISGAMPCCLPCSCSDRCSLTGNCCPDKTLPEAPSTVKYAACRSQIEIYNKILNNTESGHSDSYRVIDTCPWERSDDLDWHETASECYKATTDTSDLMFVSDAETYDVFVNKYCAECNGVRDIIYWQLHIKCPPHEIINVKSFQERDKLIRTSRCNLSSIPPSTDIGMHSVCYKRTENKCNILDNWKVYDHEVERQCNSSTLDYGYVDDDFFKYANVYCYLCNVPTRSDMKSVCPSIGFTTTKGPSVSFTALISKTDSSRVNVKAMACQEHEVMDPFMASCTDLECPITFIPYLGQCRAIVDEYEGLFVEVHLDLEPANLTNSSFPILQLVDIEHGVKQQVINQVKEASCGICDVEVIVLKDGKRVAIVIFETTKNCSIMKLMKEIESVFLNEPKIIKWSEDIDDTYVYLRKEMIKEDDVVAGSQSHARCGYRVFYSPGVLTCPSIVYQLPRLRETGVSNQTLTKLQRQSNQLSDMEFRICLESYLNIFKEAKANSASLKGGYENILVVMITTYLLVDLPLTLVQTSEWTLLR